MKRNVIYTFGLVLLSSVSLNSCADLRAALEEQSEDPQSQQAAASMTPHERYAVDYIDIIETFSEAMLAYRAGKISAKDADEIAGMLQKGLCAADDVIWGDSADSKQVWFYLDGKLAARYQRALSQAQAVSDPDLMNAMSFTMSLTAGD